MLKLCGSGYISSDSSYVRYVKDVLESSQVNDFPAFGRDLISVASLCASDVGGADFSGGVLESSGSKSLI